MLHPTANSDVISKMLKSYASQPTAWLCTE